MKVFVQILQFQETHVLELKEKYPNIDFITDPNDTDEVEILISRPEYVRDHIARYPDVKWIQITTSGYNLIDIDVLKERNIMLTNSKDVFGIQISEDVFSKILAFNRNINTYYQQMKVGAWIEQPVDHEIALSTVGIIGAGSIATEIAKKMKAFHATTIGYKRTKAKVPGFDYVYTTEDELKHLLGISDYIILILPLSKETKHFINEERLKLMKPTALLVNIARGEIVDQDALVKALKNKQIRGAALDVTHPEPLSKEHPLWKLDNVLITPHYASASPHHVARLIELIEYNLNQYLKSKKELKNIVVNLKKV